MKEKILKNRKLVDTLVLILVGIFLCIPLLNSKLNVYYDDGIQHIARAFGTMSSLKEGGILKNVISSFSNNFGYSWNLFYGPLSTIGIIFFKTITNSYINAYKLCVFVCLILSGITMYKFALKLINNNNAALLAGIFYMTFPYHLTDLYLRNALGEFVSFIFIPLVFLGLYNLFYTEDNNYHLAIGVIGLLLTHNISTLLVAIFATFYFVFNLEKVKEARIKKGLLINIIFVILITSFYWMPLLETKFSANYQVYEPGAMANSEDTASHGLSLKQLFVSQNNGSYIFELGPHIIIILALSVITFRLIKDELKENYIIFLFSGLITLWMSTKYFPWKFLPDQACIIQFPWRMEMLTAFFFSIVCSINIYTVIKKFNYKDVAVIGVIATSYTIAFVSFLPIEENMVDVTQWKLGAFSGREHEIVAGTAGGEYLPTLAHEDRFYIASREDSIYVLEGKAVIENEQKSNSNLSADLQTFDSEYTIFELPYIYYPGYEVRLDGMIAESFQTQNGFLGIVMGKDDTAELSVTYNGTEIMKLFAFISSISLICFCIYIWKKH